MTCRHFLGRITDQFEPGDEQTRPAGKSSVATRLPPSLMLERLKMSSGLLEVCECDVECFRWEKLHVQRVRDNTRYENIFATIPVCST